MGVEDGGGDPEIFELSRTSWSSNRFAGSIDAGQNACGRAPCSSEGFADTTKSVEVHCVQSLSCDSNVSSGQTIAHARPDVNANTKMSSKARNLIRPAHYTTAVPVGMPEVRPPAPAAPLRVR